MNFLLQIYRFLQTMENYELPDLVYLHPLITHKMTMELDLNRGELCVLIAAMVCSLSYLTSIITRIATI